MAIRRESVELSVTGNFRTEMAANAASVALLRREVDQLNRQRVNISVDDSQVTTAIARAEALRIELARIGGINANPSVNVRTTSSGGSGGGGLGGLRRDADGASNSINQLTGRLGLAADAALILGPGLIPIAAVGVQALGGLTAAATAAAVAGGAAVVAFQGVGEAVSAVDAYQLEPTTANFEKMQAAMKAIGPEARTFVKEFQAFQPVLTEIRDSAAAGLFPGLTASLNDFARLGPRVGNLLETVGGELGDIIGDSAQSLASNRWGGFLKFLREELPDALRSTSNIMGDLAHGAAMMFKSFDPGNDSFLSWLEGVADGFDKWSVSSEGRDSIADFLEYARESGPEVAELFTSLVGAFAAIVKAAAPLGGTVLTGLTAVANMVEKIAESDMATPLLAAVAALRIYSRVAGLATAATARFTSTQRVAATSAANRAALNSNNLTGTALGAALVAPRAGDVRAARNQRYGQYAAGAAGLGALGLLSTGTADKLNLTNTAMLTLVGTMAGPLGAGLGAVAGLTLDAAHSTDDLTASIEAANSALAGGDLEAGLANLDAAKEQLAKLKEGQDIGAWELPSFSEGMQNLKDDVRMLFGKKTDAEIGDERIRQAEDYYNALVAIENLKDVSPQRGLNDLFGGVNGELLIANGLLNDFNRGLAQANGFLSKRGALVAYEQSLDAINQALKDNGKTLDETTPKGRANIAVLDGIASSGLRLAENLRGANKTKFLGRLREDVAETARAFGLTGKPLDNFLTKLGLISRKKVKPKIELDTSLSDRKARKTKAELDDIDKTRVNPFADLYTGEFDAAAGHVRTELQNLDGDHADAYIYTHHVNVIENRVGPMIAEGSVGTGRGVKRADGGLIRGPGGPREDKIPALLSNGEFVVNAAATARNLSALHAINAQRFANGGVVGERGRGSSSADDLREFGKAAKESAKQLREEARERKQAMREYSKQVGGSLAGELTGNGLAGLTLGNAANKNDARAALIALRKAKKNGLSGPLFDLVANSGDLSLIQQISELNSAQISQQERQYGASRAAQNALGNFAAGEKFDKDRGGRGKGKGRTRDVVVAMERAVERGSARGTENGSRRASRTKSRRTATGSRAGR